jgi:hypothetical protein
MGDGQVASGAIFFTVLTTLDIWMFGIAMRKQFERVQDGLFGQHGRIILLGLALLLVAAWGLPAGFQFADWVRIVGVLVLGALCVTRDISRAAGRFQTPLVWEGTPPSCA